MLRCAICHHLFFSLGKFDSISTLIDFKSKNQFQPKKEVDFFTFSEHLQQHHVGHHMKPSDPTIFNYQQLVEKNWKTINGNVVYKSVKKSSKSPLVRFPVRDETHFHCGYCGKNFEHKSGCTRHIKLFRCPYLKNSNFTLDDVKPQWVKDGAIPPRGKNIK